MKEKDKRRALGRGLGALIPTGPSGVRPVDVFFSPATGSDPGRGADPFEGDPGAQPGDASAPASAAPPAAADSSVHDSSVHDSSAGVEAGAEGLRPVPGATFAHLPVAAIRPNPRQPRTIFDEEEMAELVHSIQEIGILQPVVVRPIGRAEGVGGTSGADETGGAAYELVVGERRWRASQAVGLDLIPAIIRTTSDDDLLRDALLENLHRSQLNPLEEAAAYRQLLDDFGCTQEELATRLGRSRPQVTNTLRLLRLPPLVQRRVAAGVLSAGHARALLGLDDGAAMERLAQRIVAEGLSVRSVEEIVAVGLAVAPAKPHAPRPGARRPQLDELAGRLSDRLDTRVQIALGRRKGKVVVEFASVEDLHRILAAMGLRAD